ncbi:MAG TPA: hypothetical protein VK145_01425 [Candidatus Nanoarchaeia archaeon]|nr:hypothetical protein [Candidatus Nanoarchaeia archaeon]
MNNRAGVVIGAIVIIVILAFTAYWQFGRNQSASVLDSQQPITQEQPQDNRIITALHQYKNGTHIIAGQADVPTPCHVLSETVSVSDATPRQATIAFTTTASGDVCAQVITSARFKTEFIAPENVIINATWNGAPVQLNLIPASAEDDLDNFDIFIKG